MARFKSHRQGVDSYSGSLPVCISSSLEDCIRKTDEYLGPLQDYFIVKEEIVYTKGEVK
jgi:hypothetical protein